MADSDHTQIILTYRLYLADSDHTQIIVTYRLFWADSDQTQIIFSYRFFWADSDQIQIILTYRLYWVGSDRTHTQFILTVDTVKHRANLPGKTIQRQSGDNLLQLQTKWLSKYLLLATRRRRCEKESLKLYIISIA